MSLLQEEMPARAKPVRQPKGWDTKRLKFCVRLVNDKVDATPLGERFVGLEHVESWSGRVLPSVAEGEQTTAEGTANRFAKGDVLFGKLRPYLAKAFQADISGYCTSELLVLRPQLLDPRFLLYSLLSPTFIEVVHGSTYGAKMPRANWEFIGNLPQLLPPLPQQRTIAAFLDRKTAAIDALIAKKQRMIELLHEKRQALISQAVTKGLHSAVTMRELRVEGFGRIPSHWSMKELRHLVPDDRQIMYGIVLPGPNVEDGIPIVKGGNCEPGRLRLDCLSRTTREIESGYVRSRLKRGDIVYAIRGSIGQAEVVPPELEGANLTQDAARISPKPGVDGRWLLWAVRSSAFFLKLDAGATGATIRGINIRDLKRAPIAVPLSGEQKLIADYIDAATLRLEEMVRKLDGGISRLREYRQTVIAAAVTGKIDVSKEVT